MAVDGECSGGDAAVCARRATVQDLAAVQHLVEEAFGRYVVRIGRRPAPMEADYRNLIERGDVWVAVLECDVVGVLVVDKYPDHLYVDTLAVAPERQGGGVGALLLAEAERLALQGGYREVRLCTNRHMTENLAYYPKRGFMETHRARENGYDRVFYRKPLLSGYNDG